MKKFLSVVMVLAMMAAFIVLPVYADDTVTTSTVAAAPNTDASYVIGTDYATLKAAFAAAPTDGTSVTYTLSGDMTYDSRVTVPEGANIVLDLAGHSLTYSSDVARANVYVKGALTVIGEGSVTNESAGYKGHVFAIEATGSLSVSGNATFTSNNGDAIHNVGGTVASVSNGSFVAANASAMSLTGAAKVESVTGGSFSGQYALYAGDTSVVTSVAGGSFTGARVGIYVKANAKIETLGAASVGAAVGASYAISNLGTIGTMSGTVVDSTAKGAISNYGTITELGGTVKFTSEAVGTGAAITNNGTITTLSASVEANTHGILNKGGNIGTISSKDITTVRGNGIYNKDGGVITTISITRVTASNRSAVYNSGANTRIDTINSGIFTSKVEKEGSADERAIGISNMAGATIGTITARRVNSYGAAIANSAATINLITGNGTYTSETVSVTNVKGGVITEVSGRCTFTPAMDSDIIYGSYTVQEVGGSAHIVVNGYFWNDDWTGTHFADSRQDYNLIRLSGEEEYNALRSETDVTKYYKNGDRDHDFVVNYGTVIGNSALVLKSGDKTVVSSLKFFTYKSIESATGNAEYFLGVYAKNGFTGGNHTFELADTANKIVYKVTLTDVGPLHALDGDYPVYCFGDQMIHEYDPSVTEVIGDAKLALFGWMASMSTTQFGATPNGQFYYVEITEALFSALTGDSATEVHYVPYGSTTTNADKDIFHYFNTNLDKGTVSGDTQFKFFTTKVTMRDGSESVYRLGVYSYSDQTATSLTYKAANDAGNFSVQISGLAPIVATAEGSYPTTFYKTGTSEAQSLVPYEETSKTVVDIAGAAKLALYGGNSLMFPASQWNAGASQYFVIEITEDMFNTLTTAGQTVYRYIDHEAGGDEANAKVIVYHYYDTVLANGEISGDTQFKFFTLKTQDVASGDVGYRLGFYSENATSSSSITVKVEQDETVYNVSISEMAAMAATPAGEHPVTYFNDQTLSLVETIAPAKTVDISGDAKLALFGGESLGFGASTWNAGASQFFVIELTEEQFNTLTPSDAVAKRYVNHSTTDADASVDHYHYYENVLTGGTKTGDTQFNFFTAKLVKRDGTGTTYLLGVYSESVTNVSAVNTTVVNGNLTVNVTINGMAAMAATPAGTLPLAYFGDGQNLIACD